MTQRIPRSRVALGGPSAAMAVLPLPLMAQDKPIEWAVGDGAGGSPDDVGRTCSVAMSASLGVRLGDMSACQTEGTTYMHTHTVRWTPQDLPTDQTSTLSHILHVLADGDDVRTVRRLLALLRVEIGAASAVANEYVLHGGVLKLRTQIADESSAPYPNSGSGESIVDPAHGHLVALARSMHGDAMFGQHGPGGYISVLYTLMANSAWALRFAPAAVGEPLRDEAMSRLGPLALLMRDLHRIVAPTETTADERVVNAAIHLGVRATALSIRERQICARIAGGHSTTAIAADLGIATSTVMTLRKRAYAKLGIHGRLDLQQLAA